MKKVYVVGNLNVDVVMGNFKNWPDIGSEVTGNFFDLRCAGAAGNNALALKKLGFEVHVISSVGIDDFGEKFFLDFERAGIDLSKCKRSRKRTGISLGISFENNERTFFTFLGALEDMDNDFIFEGLKDVKNSWIVICGFNIIPSLQNDQFLDTVAFIKSHDNEILFDPGWPPQGWNEELKKQASRLAVLSDWFVPNLSEALAISKKSSMEESIEHFKNLGVSNCIIKLGEDGANGFILSDKTLAGAFRLGKVKDTVGAGDLFNAGLIKGISMGWSSKQMVKFASFYASLGITKTGENRYPTFEEAHRKFLEIAGKQNGRTKFEGGI